MQSLPFLSCPRCICRMLIHLLGQDIPRLLESLGKAVRTLVDENTDPAKQQVWERNLKGFAGQYYGRLAVSCHCHLGDKNIDSCRLNPDSFLSLSTIRRVKTLFGPSFDICTRYMLILHRSDHRRAQSHQCHLHHLGIHSKMQS